MNGLLLANLEGGSGSTRQRFLHETHCTVAALVALATAIG
jgi:hypothetical protein